MLLAAWPTTPGYARDGGRVPWLVPGVDGGLTVDERADGDVVRG